MTDLTKRSPWGWGKTLVFSLILLIAAMTMISVQPLPFGQSATVLALDLSGGTVFYSYRRPSRDGTGKVYMGREIAQVMGHQGAAWLERPARDTQEQPQALVEALHLQPTDAIADIGAGSGYISQRLALAVPQWKVFAVDLQPEMLERLQSRMAAAQISNVEPIQGTEITTQLPAESVDVAVLVDAYHEFSAPREMMADIARILKPTGRVALVEYRGEDPRVMIKPLHKMTAQKARQELAAVGLTWQETLEVLPQQHLMIFQKA